MHLLRRSPKAPFRRSLATVHTIVGVCCRLKADHRWGSLTGSGRPLAVVWHGQKKTFRKPSLQPKTVNDREMVNFTSDENSICLSVEFQAPIEMAPKGHSFRLDKLFRLESSTFQQVSTLSDISRRVFPEVLDTFNHRFNTERIECARLG